MTPDELARLLDGREMGHEITGDEGQAAKVAGLVVVFGYSDDNVEFRGAIEGEVSAYGGKRIPITAEGLVLNRCEDVDCPYFGAAVKSAARLVAKWSDAENEPGWSFAVRWPHATFRVMEDGEEFCRGVVFRLADVRWGEG